VPDVAAVGDAAAGAHENAAGRRAGRARPVGKRRPARTGERGTGHDAEREEQLEGRLGAAPDRGATALGGADEAEAVAVSGEVCRDPRRGSDRAERHARGDAVAAPPAAAARA
jgi:hypothetical protein